MGIKSSLNFLIFGVGLLPPMAFNDVIVALRSLKHICYAILQNLYTIICDKYPLAHFYSQHKYYVFYLTQNDARIININI